MQKLNLELPLNSLSFGQVSINFLREFHRRNLEVTLYPIGNADVSVYDRLGTDFKNWLASSINNRFKTLRKNIPTFKLWHLNGSQTKIADKQVLYTFYELDNPTEEEINAVELQEATIFSSEYSKNHFINYGASPEKCFYVPLGLDPDVYSLNKKYYGENIIHFGLMGKFEARKNTAQILRLWAKKFGNNDKYRLTCCILNPFLGKNQEEIKNNNLLLINQALEGKHYWNINLSDFLTSNSAVNDFYNSIDVDLSGLSSAEGWNLPAFNATCLGKWSLVVDAHAHKSWANSENSILVKPLGKRPSADGVFFSGNGPFNVGNVFNITDESILEAFEQAEKKAKTVNTKGISLGKEMTYENSVNKILEIIEKV